MHQGTKRDRAVGAASGDHDVGPGIQRGSDGAGTQIGIHAPDIIWKCDTREHFRLTVFANFIGPGQQVIAQHDSDGQIDPGLGGGFGKRIAAATRVHAPGIGNDLDPFCLDIRQPGCQRLDEIRRIARLGRFGAGPGHQRHCHLCQIIKNQIVDLAL